LAAALLVLMLFNGSRSMKKSLASTPSPGGRGLG
jgi:hypothetical protein